jgi:hypothetical protein
MTDKKAGPRPALPELLLDFTAGWIFQQQTQPILIGRSQARRESLTAVVYRITGLRPAHAPHGTREVGSNPIPDQFRSPRQAPAPC